VLDQLIETVYKHFEQTGDWPKVRSLQKAFRHVANIEVVAAEGGAERIICEVYGADRMCKLTILGVANCDGSDVLISSFLAVVRGAVQRYIESESDESIPVSEIAAELGLSDLTRRQVGELIYMTDGIWSGLSRSPSGDVSMTPHERIWYYEHVETLDDFFAVRSRANEDVQRASRSRHPVWTQAPPLIESPPVALGAQPKPAFVNPERIEQLRQIESDSYDLRRLIAMCEELNHCSDHDCLMSIAMLTRAIIDHVPPIFDARTFAEIASSYGGGKSFKASMQHLSGSARAIADSHLHAQVRRRVALPTRTQVDFSRDLDVLLGEIVVVLE
jgi:hypothetical protein